VKTKLLFWIIAVLLITGCIGEDYDVGPPIPYVHLDSKEIEIKAANLDWLTQERDYQKETNDIKSFAEKQKPLIINEGQQVYIEFKENKENGGDYVDQSINVYLWSGNDKVRLEYRSDRIFFPNDRGSYLLEIEYVQKGKIAQYIASVIIR
jgi:hypothetical protein